MRWVAGMDMAFIEQTNAALRYLRRSDRISLSELWGRNAVYG